MAKTEEGSKDPLWNRPVSVISSLIKSFPSIIENDCALILFRGRGDSMWQTPSCGQGGLYQQPSGISCTQPPPTRAWCSTRLQAVLVSVQQQTLQEAPSHVLKDPQSSHFWNTKPWPVLESRHQHCLHHCEVSASPGCSLNLSRSPRALELRAVWGTSRLWVQNILWQNRGTGL